MDIIYWTLITVMFLVGFVGLIFPIIPSVLFIIGGIILYGLLFTFEPFNWVFWLIQILFVVLLFAADYVANLLGVKKYGGTKAGIWGSTIGLLAGPFIIPFFGILLGPFIGAVIAEMIVHRTNLVTAGKIGLGSVVGFISGTITKGLILLFMIVYFLFVVL